MTVEVRFKALSPELGATIPFPKQMSEGAAGMDVCAALEASVVIAPGERAMIPCGFAMAVPEGYEVQVRPRSGLAWKKGITVLNTPGTIDADYRGEVKVVLINHGTEPFEIQKGERIAQLVVAEVPRVSVQVVDTLEDTDRGTGGFGSTGV